MTMNLSNFNFYSHQADKNKESKKNCIHSGQFMVSEFESEEAQEDEETTIDPEATLVDDVSQTPNQNTCSDIQLYVPTKTLQTSDGNQFIINSHLEIETSLTKLFKCMNLAYSQKLTSPKWNHFKGVRLRWKDKIRLNNVIWRCWHMQFILKRRTPVCQFDISTDIHTNPQSVVLEGKYWKRQFNVITAEYRKWRRNFISKAIGYSPYYNEVNEFDFELSVPDDRLLANDFFLSDTLFSTFNAPFQFPDRREIENITRNANNNADLLQPNLGALQPNIDDIDITFQELLQSSRLPPVPEESEDIFKSIMGTEHMDSANIIEITNSNQMLNDASMSELNTPIVENQIDMLNDDPFSSTILTESVNNPLLGSVNSVLPINSFPIVNTNSYNSLENTNHSGFPAKNSIIKGRVSKPSSRTFRKREPHNYDKAQPTLHQTSIYQQMLQEQQQTHQHQQQQQQNQNPRMLLNQSSRLQQSQTSIIQQNTSPSSHHSIVQSSLQQPQINFNNQQQQTFSTNNFIVQSDQNTNNTTSSTNHTIIKSFSLPQTPIHLQTPNEKSQSEILSIVNYNNCNLLQGSQQQQQQQQYLTNLRKASSTDYINVTNNCNTAANASNFIIPILDSNTPKEMLRSNSLPLNTQNIKLETNKTSENFAVPKYQASKGNRTRSRSYSIQHNNQNLTYIQQKSQMQAATSDPMLHNNSNNSNNNNNHSNNSPLAQLLITNNTITAPISSNASAISFSLPPNFNSTSLANSSTNYQVAKSKNDTSPMKSNSLPQNVQLSSPTIQSLNSFTSTSSNQSLNLSTDDSQQHSPSKTQNSSYPRETQRRAGHIHAEQKRRYNIKNGFDLMYSLIPQLQQNPNAKLSKAAMLQKGAEYIKQLRAERNLLNEKMEAFRKERENLNNSISHLHSVLPANGAHTVTRQRTEKIRQLYNQYVRFRTRQNYKFWILGLILEPLLSSYINTVSIISIEELQRTALHWVDQHCSLIELRPAVSNKLRYLSMTTDILSDPPTILEEEVMKAINNQNDHPNLNSS